MTATIEGTATRTPAARRPALTRPGLRRDLLVLVAVLLLGLAAPFVLSTGELAIGIRVLVFALMGIGWNIMSGFGGMFSFGHAAYFGIGAYTTAWLVAVHGVSPWLGLVAGTGLAALAAVGISYLAFRYRLQGAYYAMSTFAFAEMLRLFVTGNETLHKTVGFTVPVLPEASLAQFQFDVGSPVYFWLGVLMVAVALLVSILFRHGRTGRFTMAVRDDEQAAASLGVNVLRYKLTAVAVSAAVTASAGTLYVQYYMFVDPDLAFGSSVSNNAIITAVIGGVGTLWGPLLGAVVTAPLSDLMADLLRDPPAALAFLQGHSGLDVLLYAVLLVAVVVLLPRGVIGTLTSRRWRR